MASLNRVALIGNLGRDPEVKTLNRGNKVVSFSLACGESWRDKETGEKRERTEWVNCTIYNENIGKIVEQYCKKGSKIYIEGKFRTRKWQDRDGADRWSTEVVVENFGGQLVLLDGKKQGGDRDDDTGGFGRSSSSSAKPETRGGGYVGGSLSNDLDDEIPFTLEWR